MLSSHLTTWQLTVVCNQDETNNETQGGSCTLPPCTFYCNLTCMLWSCRKESSSTMVWVRIRTQYLMIVDYSYLAVGVSGCTNFMLYHRYSQVRSIELINSITYKLVEQFVETLMKCFHATPPFWELNTGRQLPDNCSICVCDLLTSNKTLYRSSQLRYSVAFYQKITRLKKRVTIQQVSL